MEKVPIPFDAVYVATHLLHPRRDWRDDRNCKGVDPKIFFLEHGANSKEVEIAKDYCRHCDVRDDCLVSALDEGDVGFIAGGLTQRERKPLIRLRREAMAKIALENTASTPQQPVIES